MTRRVQAYLVGVRAFKTSPRHAVVCHSVVLSLCNPACNAAQEADGLQWLIKETWAMPFDERPRRLDASKLPRWHSTRSDLVMRCSLQSYQVIVVETMVSNPRLF